MKTLLDEDFKNENADRPWKKSERDKMIDLYLAGTPPSRVAIMLKRNPKGIRRRLEQYTYNEREMLREYFPYTRASRKGKRITENERVMMAAWDERGVEKEHQARFLQRSLGDLAQNGVVVSDLISVAAKTDIVIAHRYLFYCVKRPVVTDKEYDDLKREEMEYGGGHEALSQPASDRNVDYPDYIRALALYMLHKAEGKNSHPWRKKE